MSEKWKELVKEAQERAVIDAAVELFENKGYIFTSMDEVAEKAGISKTTIYKLFPSKEELFIRVVENVHRDFQEKINEIEIGDFPSSFTRLIDVFFSVLQKRYGLIKILMVESFDAPFIKENRRRFLEKIRKNRGFYRNVLVNFLKKGKEEGYFDDSVNMMAGFITALFKGIVLEVLFFDPEMFKEFSAYTRGKILELVGIKEVINE